MRVLGALLAAAYVTAACQLVIGPLLDGALL